MNTMIVSGLSVSPLPTPNSSYLDLEMVLYNNGTLMATKLDPLMKVMRLFSPQMGPVLFHGSGRKELLQFGTSILGELLLSSSPLIVTLGIAVFPLMANL